MQRRRRVKERRRSQRLPLAIPIFAKGADDRGQDFLEFTSTLNISATGALVAMRRYLSPSSKVLLEIPAAPLPRLSVPPQFVRTLQANLVRVIFAHPSYLWALRFDQPLE